MFCIICRADRPLAPPDKDDVWADQSHPRADPPSTYRDRQASLDTTLLKTRRCGVAPQICQSVE